MSQIFVTPRTSHTALPNDDKNIAVATPSLPQEVTQSANVITTMKSSLEDLGVSEIFPILLDARFGVVELRTGGFAVMCIAHDRYTWGAHDNDY